ncbi:hypothetical protein KR009_005227 [Drosophila setifemur]|nr:hypothetical protein KR009_005227 [Drosophila setifemur]
MLDRLKFNNLVIKTNINRKWKTIKKHWQSQVVTNKKVIQKARAQTIAKLVQKLRKAKDVLVKHPDSEKDKTRLRKNTECMAQLKALNCIDIVRQSLLQEGTNPNTVIASERSTPDELGIAMLRLNKLMHGLVDKFMSTLKLNNGKDVAWREEILESSKRQMKIKRTEEKKRKRKELKDQKAQTRNRLEWLNQNKVEIVDNSESDVPTVPDVSEPEKDEELKSVLKPKNRVVLSKKDPLKPNSATKAKSSEYLSRKEPIMRVQANKSSPKEKKVQSTKKRQANREIKGKQLLEARIDKQQSVDSNSEPDKNRPTHVVDPFFITETGQPYLSTAVFLSDDNNSEGEKEPKPPHVKKFRNEHRRADRTQMERPERLTQFNTKKLNDGRHPSWLAKQQQKPIIGDFRGKKITFSEDGQASDIKAPYVNSLANNPTATSTEGMHPSWVAKQKWKPKIAAFQGTKIKFDEE